MTEVRLSLAMVTWADLAFMKGSIGWLIQYSGPHSLIRRCSQDAFCSRKYRIGGLSGHKTFTAAPSIEIRQRRAPFYRDPRKRIAIRSRIVDPGAAGRHGFVTRFTSRQCDPPVPAPAWT